MKKNFWLGAMAVVTLLATSCQNDEYSMENRTSVVSFTLEQPSISTRAFSDGTGPKQLVYAVYDANKNPVTPKSGYEEGEGYGTVAITDKKATVSIEFESAQLNKDYTFVFWAAHPDAPYTFDANAGTITDNATEIVGNDETRDAFFASITLTVDESGVEERVTLRRPFAQLNIGAQGEFISFQPTKCTVKVSDVYNEFSLIDGKVTGTATEVTYSEAAFPDNEIFPTISGVKYLSMNYLLVPADKELVNVTYTLSNDETSKNPVTVDNVPVQRNYRTNIVITPNFAKPNTAVFVTKIDERYEQPDYKVPPVSANGKNYNSIAEAILAGETNMKLSGGTYTIPSEAKTPENATPKEFTFVGAGSPEDVIIEIENGDGKLANSIVTFENLTLKLPENVKYNGFQHIAGANYKNCVIEGLHFLYGESKFDNCTFDNSGDNYNVWTYGASKTTFTRCTFNCDGKAVLIYTEGEIHAEHTFENCVFNDSDKLDTKKAAIEIGSSPYSTATTYEVIANGCQVNGFAINDEGTNTGTTLWGNKNSMDTEHLSIIIDGTEVY